MMDKAALGCPDISIAQGRQSQAKINIVANYCKFFIEASDSLEFFPAQHQAGTSAGSDLPDSSIEPSVNLLIGHHLVKQVGAATTEVYDEDTRVLNRAIGIQQQTTHGTHFRTHSMSQ